MNQTKPKEPLPLIQGGQGRPDIRAGEEGSAGAFVAFVFVLLSAFGLCAGVFEIIARK